MQRHERALKLFVDGMNVPIPGIRRRAGYGFVSMDLEVRHVSGRQRNGWLVFFEALEAFERIKGVGCLNWALMGDATDELSVSVQGDEASALWSVRVEFDLSGRICRLSDLPDF